MRIKRSVLLACFFLVAAAIAMWIVASTLVSPQRRALMPHHLDWLTYPTAHGISVRQFNCQDDASTCLLVEPDKQAGPARRGRAIREQLLNEGIELPPYGDSRGILVLLHSRTGRKEDLLPVAERFAAVGFRCLIPDLPGHGRNRIKATRYASDRSEGDLAGHVLLEARRLYGLPDEPAGIWGLSMGSSYATRAAFNNPPIWKALVVASGFDSLENVLSDKLARILGPLAPAAAKIMADVLEMQSGLKVSGVQPALWAREVHTPVLVVHGEKDKVVQLERGQALFHAFASKDKRLQIVPDAGHDDLLITPTAVYPAMAKWFMQWVVTTPET